MSFSYPCFGILGFISQQLLFSALWYPQNNLQTLCENMITAKHAQPLLCGRIVACKPSWWGHLPTLAAFIVFPFKWLWKKMWLLLVSWTLVVCVFFFFFFFYNHRCLNRSILTQHRLSTFWFLLRGDDIFLPLLRLLAESWLHSYWTKNTNWMA